MKKHKVWIKEIKLEMIVTETQRRGEGEKYKEKEQEQEEKKIPHKMILKVEAEGPYRNGRSEEANI